MHLPGYALIQTSKKAKSFVNCRNKLNIDRKTAALLHSYAERSDFLRQQCSCFYFNLLVLWMISSLPGPLDTSVIGTWISCSIVSM